MKKLASAVVASSLFAAACGSNETIEVLGSTPAASAGEAPTTETPTSEMPTTTAAPTEAPATLGFDAGNEAAGSEYCEIARHLDENEAPFSIYDDPETLQTYVTGVMEEVERMEEVAPPEIKADFTVVKSGLDIFQQLLIDAGWDFNAASTEMQELFADNPGSDAASEALDAYDRDVCGIGDKDDATIGTTSED